MRFKQHLHYYISLLLIFFLGSCSNSDCPLSNVVHCYYTFYSSESGEAVSYTDTLTILAADTTLLNKAVGKSSFDIPMSYGLTTDSLTFQFRTADGVFVSQVNVNHSNKANYVSLDCGIAFFHTIKNVDFKSSPDYPIIDSIVVVKPEVNYDKIENIRIYLADL